MNSFQQITIVGCGLLGGSFALALRRAGYTGKIAACGGTRGAKIALERGMINSLEESFAQSLPCQADLIFLAAPIGGIIDFLKSQSAQIKSGAIVTDAGSTKVEICRLAREILPSEINFIGGHPMAGSEQTGVEYARADLFDGATWALMDEEGIDQSAIAILTSLVEAMGARTVITNPASHDAAVALISHLPQLLSSSLANLLTDEGQGLARQLAATGWRDMTRLAGSSWSVWRDIVMTNQPNISQSIDTLIAELQQIKEALDIHEFNQVRELFSAANDSVAKQRTMHYQKFKKII